MNFKSITKFLSATIFFVGLIGGLIIMFTQVETGAYYTYEEYSVFNMCLGLAIMISNSFIASLAMLFVQHLENQEKQIFFLNVLAEKQEIIEKGK